MNLGSNDRLMVLAVFIFGLAAIGGSSYWLNEGSITIRQGEGHSGVAPANPNAPIAGQIAGDHFLFYPVCAVWELLGAAMVILSTLAFFRGDVILLRLTAYSGAAFFFLAFATIGLAMLVKPS